MNKKLTFTVILMTVLLLGMLNVPATQARDPTFGVAQGEVHTYKLEICELEGSSEGVNFTLYWGDSTNNYTDVIVNEGDEWSFRIDNITIGEHQYYGPKVTLLVGDQSFNDTHNQHLLSEKLLPWELYDMGLYESFIQDTHSDNDSYWQAEANAILTDVNMTHYEQFTINVTEDYLWYHMRVADGVEDPLQEIFVELDLNKGVFTEYETWWMPNNQWTSGDHIKVVSKTVPPSSSSTTGTSDGTTGSESSTSSDVSKNEGDTSTADGLTPLLAIPTLALVVVIRKKNR